MLVLVWIVAAFAMLWLESEKAKERQEKKNRK